MSENETYQKIKSQVDRVWESFWSGGIANPLEVLEQITYLLFLKRLDELQTLEENKSRDLGKPMNRQIFPDGFDDKGCNYVDMRWAKLKNFSEREMYRIVSEHVFPFLQKLGGDKTTYARHMEDARFTIPTPALLAKVVDLLDQIPMENRDTKGDLYEYMLSKIASAGQNGQFRTPRHIIKLMVEMVEPSAKDIICDPSSGTCGFLMVASEFILEKRKDDFTDKTFREHFHNKMFNGFDFDGTMLRIGSMNMLLHGVDNANVSYRDSLSQEGAVEEEKYSLILANPPFKGSLDYEGTANDLLAVTKTKKTEVLFLTLFLKLLKPGGRAAVIVPQGILFNQSKVYKKIRTILVNEQKLDAVISLPTGVFKPYAGVSTAILFFTKTNSGGTETVWFYDLHADGFSLDDKRNPLLEDELLGTYPSRSLGNEEHDKNNLPDLLARWVEREGKERDRKRTDQSFAVNLEEIKENDYNLSLNQYKEIVRERINYESPEKLLEEIINLENEIRADLEQVEKIIK